MDSESPELKYELPPEVTPLPVVEEITRAAGGAGKLKFRQAYMHCKGCDQIFPAQFEVSLDPTKLRCPLCGVQDSEIHSEETRED